MKRNKLKAYWRAVRKVCRVTGRSVSIVRHVYSGQTVRLRSIVALKSISSAFRRDAQKAAVFAAQKRYPYLTQDDIRKSYTMLVDYSPGSLERIAVPPGGKRPTGVTQSAWDKYSYIPKSGVAKGFRVLYRHKATGEYLGQSAMRRWYASAYAMKYLTRMPEVLQPSDRFGLSQLPDALKTGISKTAMMRGYFTEREAVRWMAGLLDKVKRQNRFDIYDMLITVWPELEDTYGRYR